MQVYNDQVSDSYSAVASGITFTLYPTDLTYDHELQRTTDSGGTPNSSNWATQIIYPAETLVTSGMQYYDVLPNDGSTYWYRWRDVKDGYVPGNWSTPVQMTVRQVDRSYSGPTVQPTSAYSAQTSDPAGLQLEASVEDSRTYAVNGMLATSYQDISAVSDGGGYAKTTTNQVTGAGYGYTNLDSSGVLAGKLIRSRGFDDGEFAVVATDTLGRSLQSTVVDSRAYAVNGMFATSHQDVSAISDGGGYGKTTSNQVTGAGRAFSALNSSNVLTSGVDRTATIAGNNAAVVSRGQGAGVFTEHWEAGSSATANWTVVAGSPASGTPYVTSESGAGLPAGYGNNCLVMVGETWYVWNKPIPYDPTKLYKMTARMTVGSYGGGSASDFLAGFIMYAADGTTILNRTGANAVTNLNYFCAFVTQIYTSTAWVTFEGFIQGANGTVGSNASDPNNPDTAYPGSVYFAPLLVANYTGTTTAQMNIDSIEVTEYDPSATKRAYGAINSSNRIADESHLPMVRVGNIGASQGGTNPVGVPVYMSGTGLGSQWGCTISPSTLTIGSHGSISYSGASITLTGDATTYFFYISDPNFAGGSPTINATTIYATVVGSDGNYYVGAATTGVSGGGGGSSGGGGGGGACFEGDTLISMADGRAKEIKDIIVGDEVKSFDSVTGEIANSTVTDVMVHDVTDVLVIETESGKVVTTPEHPFYVGNGVFVAACSLKADDVVMMADGDVLIGDCIRSAHMEIRSTKVYNVEVQDLHTYIANGYAVHNIKMQ